MKYKDPMHQEMEEHLRLAEEQKTTPTQNYLIRNLLHLRNFLREDSIPLAKFMGLSVEEIHDLVVKGSSLPTFKAIVDHAKDAEL